MDDLPGAIRRSELEHRRMKFSQTLAIATSATCLAVGLTGCGGAPSQATASSKPSTSTPATSATSNSLSTYEAYTTLAEGQVTDPCSPTQKEIDALDQSLVDDHGITQTGAHTYTLGYLANTCTTKKAEAAEKAKAAALTSPKSYAAIGKRDLAKVFRDPDSYVGKKYVVYAEVTQFDSGTGTDQFRADVAHADLRSENSGYWLDGENAMVSVGAADISDIVQDDIVKMYVEVAGSLTYDTTIGGSTTVPQFTVNIIKRIGTSE
jgi:hypothetical protein